MGKRGGDKPSPTEAAQRILPAAGYAETPENVCRLLEASTLKLMEATYWNQVSADADNMKAKRRLLNTTGCKFYPQRPLFKKTSNTFRSPWLTNREHSTLRMVLGTPAYVRLIAASASEDWDRFLCLQRSAYSECSGYDACMHAYSTYAHRCPRFSCRKARDNAEREQTKYPSSRRCPISGRRPGVGTDE